jgi:hypothetical protein
MAADISVAGAAVLLTSRVPGRHSWQVGTLLLQRSTVYRPNDTTNDHRAHQHRHEPYKSWNHQVDPSILSSSLVVDRPAGSGAGAAAVECNGLGPLGGVAIAMGHGAVVPPRRTRYMPPNCVKNVSLLS